MNTSHLLPLVPVPLFAISLVMYTIGAHTKNRLLVRVFQPLTAGIIVFTAMLSFLTARYNPMYSVLVIMSLLVCFAADIAFINAEDDTNFLFLLSFFVIYHIITIVAISVVQPSLYIAEAIALPILLLMVVPLLIYIWPGFESMGKLALAFKIGVVAYAAIWVAHVVRACGAFAPGGFSLTQAVMLSAGSFLFFVGDLKLGPFKFRPEQAEKSKFWQFMDLIAPVLYGGGQMLYALSASYFQAA